MKMEHNPLNNVNIAALRLESKIGEGTFGIVYKVTLNDATTVAVKKLKTNDIDPFQREVENLQKVNHPNIIRILGSSADDEQLLIVMEFANCGSLSNYLHGSQHATQFEYDWQIALGWLAQTATGIAYLHGKGVIHRDLKTANILLSNDYLHCKICDFGIASEPRTTLTNGRGTAEYMAPEVFKTNKYTFNCDVYSYGIVTWEVLSRRKPYTIVTTDGSSPNFTNSYALIYAVGNGLRPEPLRDCPPSVSEVLAQCHTEDTSKRPTMLEVLGHLTIIQTKLRPDSPTVSRLPLTVDSEFPTQPPAELAAAPIEPARPVGIPNTVFDRSLPLVHTVVAGETAYGIARKYGMKYPRLCELNPTKEDMNKIRVGEELIISHRR